jgi:aquaporin Z
VLIHLVSIPVTNTSVNPACTTGPALFAGGEYLSQLWLFWLVVAGLLSRWLQEPVSGDA